MHWVNYTYLRSALLSRKWAVKNSLKVEVSSQNTAVSFDSTKRLIRQEESALATTTKKSPGRQASTQVSNPSDRTDGDDFDPPESVSHKYLVHLSKTATGLRWKLQTSQLKGEAAWLMHHITLSENTRY